MPEAGCVASVVGDDRHLETLVDIFCRFRFHIALVRTESRFSESTKRAMSIAHLPIRCGSRHFTVLRIASQRVDRDDQIREVLEHRILLFQPHRRVENVERPEPGMQLVPPVP